MNQRHTPTSLSEVWAKPSQGADTRDVAVDADRPANPILHISIELLAPTRRNGGTRHENRDRRVPHPVVAASCARLRRDPDELEPFARVDRGAERELRAAFEAVQILG